MKTKLLYTSILLLPFEASIIGIGGVFRPLLFYPALILFLSDLVFRRVSIAKDFVWIATLYAVCSFYGFIIALDFSVLLKNSYVLVTLIVYLYLWQELLKKVNIGLLANLVLISSFIPVIIGFLQFFLDYTPFNDFILYKNTDRIQLTFAEQNFSVVYLIFSYHIAKYSTFPKTFLSVLRFAYIALLIVSFSSLGYSLIIFYFLWYFKPNIRHIIYLLFVVLLMFSIGVENPYLAGRIRRLYSFVDNESFMSVLLLDDSIFLRLGNPIIAMDLFRNNWLYGVGVNNFHLYFYEYIMENIPEAMNLGQVKFIIENRVGITPKSFIPNILVSGGLLFGLPLLWNIVKSKWRSKEFLFLFFLFGLQIDALNYPLILLTITLHKYARIDGGSSRPTTSFWR